MQTDKALTSLVSAKSGQCHRNSLHKYNFCTPDNLRISEILSWDRNSYLPILSYPGSHVDCTLVVLELMQMVVK